MTRIVELKSTVKKEMNGVHLIAYFLQNLIQPLQARISKMWSYSSVKDKLGTSEEEVPGEIFQKQVRSLTKRTRKDKVPPCPTKPFTTSN
jgi:hypothetical protein